MKILKGWIIMSGSCRFTKKNSEKSGDSKILIKYLPFPNN